MIYASMIDSEADRQHFWYRAHTENGPPDWQDPAVEEEVVVAGAHLHSA